MKNLYFAIAMAVATFVFVGCQVDCALDLWETPNTPIETSYELKTDHKRSEIANGVIFDIHIAELLENNALAEAKEYAATFQPYVGSARLSRSEAEALRGLIVGFDNGFILNGKTISASAELIGCESVFFETNYTCYCHQRFAQDGAIAKLTCCEILPIRMEIGNINGNVLYADVIFKGHTEIAYPVEFAITEDVVYGYEYEEYAYATSAIIAALKEYVTKDGVRTGEFNILYGSIESSLEAGDEIVKTSADIPSLNGNIGNINGNKVSFSYTLDGTTFTDSWTATMQSEVEFVTSDGKKIRRTLKDSYTVKSVSFEKNGNVWTNTANLYIANFVCDSDAQTIRINPVISYEHDDNATVLDPNTAGLNVYKCENGVKTGEVSVAKANYDATLTAGARIERTSEDVLKLSNINATLSGNNASFTYALGNKSLNDTWKYSATASANFTLPDGSTVSVPVKATYSVKSTSFTSNNGVYSNTATLYAGNIALASDVQQIKVVDPAEYTIPGYRCVKADQTDRYDADRTSWESTPICAWFESLSDESKTLFVAYDERNGSEIYREDTSDQKMPTNPLAMIWTGNKFEAGYVIIKTDLYKYYKLDDSYYTTVSPVSTSTSKKLRNPHQGSGTYDDTKETRTFTLTNGTSLILK